MKKIFNKVSCSVIILLLLSMTSCSWLKVFDPPNKADPKATYISHVDHRLELQLDGASSVTTAIIDNLTYLFVAGAVDGGVSVFSVDSNGQLTNVFNISDDTTLNLSGVQALTTATIEDATYLFAAGALDNGISVFSVDSNGQLTNVFNISDNATLNLNGVHSLTTTVVKDTTYLFAASHIDKGINVFSVDANGQLIYVSNVSDNVTLNLDGVHSVTTTVIEDTTYLFAAGSLDDGISVFSVDANGQLASVSNVSDNATLNLDGVHSVTTAVIGNSTYLFAAGYEDDGISVFSVDANGQLASVSNISDDTDLKLNGVQALTTATIEDATYLFAAGSLDNGISVFSVANNGTLTSVSNIPDDANIELASVEAMTTMFIGTTTYLFAAGSLDDGVSSFSVADNGNLTPTDSFDDKDKFQYQMDGVISLVDAVVDGTPYLLVAGEYSDGFNVFEMDASGAISLVTSVFDSLNATNYKLKGIQSLATAEISEEIYVVAAGSIDEGFSIFRIHDDGELENTDNISDNSTLKLATIGDVITVNVGGNTYIISAGSRDDGISSFRLDAQGKISPVTGVGANIADTDNLAYHLRGVKALASATLENSTYVFAAGKIDNGISTFLLSETGLLSSVPAGHVADNDNVDYNLNGVSALSIAAMGNAVYLFAAGTKDNGISVFKIASDGTLTNVENIIDSDNTEDYTLAGVQALSTVTHEGVTYLMTAAGDMDNGVSIWKVGHDGQLTFMDSFADSKNDDYKLDGSIDVLPVILNGTLYFYVAGHDEDAINIFSIK